MSSINTISSSPSSSKEAAEILRANLLFFAFTFGIFLWIHVSLNFNGYYGQDSHAYLAYAKQTIEYIGGGQHPGSFFWPANFPTLGALLGFALPKFKLGLPLIAALSFFFLLVSVAKAVRHTFKAAPNDAACFVFATLGLSPVLLRASVVAMSDMTAILAAFLCWHFSQIFLKTPSLRHLVACCLWAGISVGTRYACAILLIWPAWQVLKKIWALKTLRYLWFGIPLIALGLLPTWILSGDWLGWSQHSNVHHFSPLHWFQADFSDHPDGHMVYGQINLVFISDIFFKPDYCWLLPLLFLFLGPKETNVNKCRSAWILVSIYLLFVAGLQTQNPRFLLPALPFLIFCLYPSWTRLNAFLNPAFRIVFWCFWAAGSLFLFWRICQPMIATNQLEQHLSQRVKTLPPGDLYTFAIDSALSTYDVKRSVINLWDKPITTFKNQSYVLFNPRSFQRQWQHKNPMQNWERLKQQHQLQLIATFDKGWQLHKILAKPPK